MDEILMCPTCHVAVKPLDYFCSNCGKNLHPVPPSLSSVTIFGFIVGSIVLPPMGFIWGIRYLKSDDNKARFYGFVFIIITIVELILLTIGTIQLINTINQQVNSQMQNIQGL
jgi:uncharacterized protein (DUF983 family)